LLPNALGAPVYGSLQRFVNARCGIFLHSGQDMAVKIERNTATPPRRIFWHRRMAARAASINTETRAVMTQTGLSIRPLHRQRWKSALCALPLTNAANRSRSRSPF
jgi:hypothetical protein